MVIGIVSNLMTVILKSAASNKVEGEIPKKLIETLVDDASGECLNKINSFINSNNYKIAYVLSEENLKSMNISEDHIGNVVAEIKCLLSRISITDEILRGCKYNAANLEEFLLDEYYKSNDYIEYESDIKTALYSVAEVLIDIERESEDFEKELLIQISNTGDDTNTVVHKILEYLKDNIEKSDADTMENEKTAVQVEKFQNNKKQDYIDNWNSRLFLHLDNDENPITLADAFIMPHYKYHIREKRIKISGEDTMNEVVEKFIMYNRSANMLITGVPGIGKTSIVSWIANEYKENDDIIILRFRDWERDELDDGLFKAICNTLNCVKRDLKNKIIVLDGFDEIKALDNGENLVRIFLNDILDFRNIKVIITSRTYYIDDYIFQYIFNLLPFGLEEIKRFYNIITGKKLENIINFNNMDVLGIPVILYMAIMSDINITMEATKPELYSKIFAEKGGIFDKFSYSGSGYDYGNQALRDIQNIKIYLEFLQEIAFKMFDENKLSLTRKEDEIPKITFQRAEISVLEFPIKNLFENAISYIEFVHKSIYEYFVSEYIFNCISSKVDLSIEEIACSFGKIFNRNFLTPEVIEFLKYKVQKGSICKQFNKISEVFNLMIKNGMTYFTQKCYKNVIEREMMVFINMLEFIHLWGKEEYVFDYQINNYFKYKTKISLNLKKVKLNEDTDLSGANLKGSDLDFSDLQNVNLQNADLRKAKLRKANLRNADLRNVDFRGADLNGADLRGARIEGVIIYFVNFNDVIMYKNQFEYLAKRFCFTGIKINIAQYDT